MCEISSVLTSINVIVENRNIVQCKKEKVMISFFL